MSGEITSRVVWQETKHNICPCTYCSGSGVLSRKEMVNYHKREYHQWQEPCSRCDGEGRKVEVSTRVRVEIKSDEVSPQYVTHEFSFREKLRGRSIEDIYPEVRR